MRADISSLPYAESNVMFSASCSEPPLYSAGRVPLDEERKTQRPRKSRLLAESIVLTLEFKWIPLNEGIMILYFYFSIAIPMKWWHQMARSRRV